MQEFILVVINDFGYLGILILIMLENLLPPIPSEVILLLGGFFTTNTSLQVGGVILFSTLGSVLGAIILYYLGYTGRNLMKKEKINVGKASAWFLSKGTKAVFLGRFVPIIRSLISIPAGVSKMFFLPFLIYTTFGSLIWNSVLIVSGRVLGKNYGIMLDVLDKYAKVVLGLFLLIIFIKIIWKRYNRTIKVLKVKRLYFF